MTEDGVTFLLTPRTRSTPDAAPVRRVPTRAPGPGEQYRFHVDMGKCIGCKCCVVACNEQNGNPAAINWRRVAEIEGGWYPRAERSYMSVGCHHCLEPTCLQGCPVDAYKKDATTGIVLHSADACIGCQYCTWNCSYGVPQYNAERGVVGKCDMCHGRLGMGESPACVSACPSGAIQIEIVNLASWRASVAAATSSTVTGMPADDQSISTTRITLPKNLPPNARPVDLVHARPGDPHWPLVVMMVFTQLSVGTFASIWLLQLAGAFARLHVAALTSLAVALLALGASTLHLGRPVYAYRALKMWRRSWLSREVLLFSGFSGVACLYAIALWRQWPAGPALGALTLLLGFGGVTASACIYRVPSRPAWNSPLTLVQFNLTALTLGPLFAAASGAGSPRGLAVAAATMAGAQLVVLAIKFFNLSAADSVEMKASSKLLSTTLRPHLIARGVLLALGAIALPLFTSSPVVLWLALALALAAETIGRYLFFVSAVPKHLVAPYLGSEAA
ncbi:MAG TPA: DmsC/YnfH family molybdoenzyme membrane anchor subunit [Vicinamibacterales bacterium]|nr:DmsC/YnfH family molybdoenzyme membrane anchor subunit [Vicinamibacterales bacterium]